MIKFFRSLRQKLLSENKFSKYLLYAIGEILLVIIGILIALSINNWNEEIAMIKKERELIIQMKNNLSDNLVQLNDYFEEVENKLTSIQLVLHHLRNEIPLHDSLGFHLFAPFSPGITNFTSSAYETFKSTGLDLIRSNELRDEIIKLYEISYPQLSVDTKDRLNNWEVDMIVPYYFNNFSVDKKVGLIPNDHDVLINDQKFINLLTLRVGIFNNILTLTERLKATTQKTIESIDRYLE